MNFYIIAGENSGDLIGMQLMKAIKKEQPGMLKFHGIGGRNMEATGLESLFDIQQINLMGVFEVIPHIFRLKKLIYQTVEDILSKGVKTVITIDSPGFTFRVASKIRKIAPHVRLVHIVAPSVWAYKPGRAKKYAQIYDHIFTLLPFEPKYFTEHGLASTYIGHPVLEQPFLKGSNELREEMNIRGDLKVVAVTPGSRKNEIARHMPIITKAFDKLSTIYKIKALFVQPDESNIQELSKYLSSANFDYGFSTDRLKSFAVSDCALAKSGTNTLEINASGTPMIIGYKLNALTYYLLRLMIKVKYVSLINIIPNKKIIPEYIQSEFNSKNIVLALSNLLNDKKKSESQVTEAQKILKSIGFNANKAPSSLAAKKIVNLIRC